MAKSKKNIPKSDPAAEVKKPAAEKAEASVETVKAAEQKADDASPEEKDGALSSFLNRKPEEKKPGKLTDSRKKTIILIVAVAAVAALVLLLIFLRKQPLPSQDEESSLPAQISLDVGEDGEHEAVVAVDENGDIRQNGNGSLLTYVRSDIKQIDVENKDGSFRIIPTTPDGEGTAYTVVGLEDYEIQSDIADEIAGKCAQLDFSKVISADADLAEYGLDEPAAKVTVTYQDDTYAVIRVGDTAPAQAGAYVSFGSSKAVYLVDLNTVSSFSYSVNKLVSQNITDKVEDSALLEFSDLTVSGTRYDEPITLEPNRDEAVGFSYEVTAPRRMFADEIESHDIAGNIRGLFAESVVCVNPSSDQLKSYGLDEPYASVKAAYPDTDIVLHASAPNEDGTVNLYNPDKKVIYSIQLAAVCWVKTGLEQLTPENPLNVNLAHVAQIGFSAGDTDFTVDVSSDTHTVTDEDTGTEQTVTDTTASCNGKALDTGNFQVFFQNINAIKNLGSTDEKAGGKVLTITFRYTTDRSDDTVTVYEGSKDYLLDVNGVRMGSVSKSYIDKLIAGGADLIKGETVESL